VKHTGPHGVVEVNPFASFTYNNKGKGVLAIVATNKNQNSQNQKQK